MAITPGQVEFEEKKEDLATKEKAKDFFAGKEHREEKPEKRVEGGREVIETKKEEIKEETAEKPRIKENEIGPESSLTPKAALPGVFKTPLQQKIEELMSEDLEKVYANMNEAQKKAFREEGEKTAGKIEKLIQHVKVKTKKILDLIRHWLKLIPGVNKFFLEQEAKIKTDRILKLKNKGQ